MSRRLGALRPDPHILSLMPRLELHVDANRIPVCPSYWADLDPTGKRYPMYGNDTLDDCVVAWIGHNVESLARFQDAQAPTMHDLILPEADIEAWFWAEIARQTGQPVQPVAPGQGLDPAKAALNLAKNPIGTATAVSDLFACSVGLSNLQFLRWVAWNFRGFGLAVELPDDWEQTFDAKGPWAVSEPADPNNGHMTFCNGYDTRSGQFQLATWGELRWVTQEWLQTYGYGGIVFLTSQWRNVPGLNTASLEAEIVSLGGSVILNAAA